MAQTSSPLLAGPRRGGRGVGAGVAAAVAMGCIGLTLLARQAVVGRSVLLASQARAEQDQLALTLLRKGEKMQAMAAQEIALGERLTASGGLSQQLGLVPSHAFQILAANASNASDCTGSNIECSGINIDMWPQNHEITRLPGYHPPEPVEPANETLESIEEDHDFYNRMPLRKAGVNIGTFFWEDPEIDAPPKNASYKSPEEVAADEELEALLDKMENATSPEERLAKAGIKLDGMPWDPEPEYDDDWDEDYDEDSGDESEEGEAAEAKSRPAQLKIKKGVQLKQHKLQLTMRKALRPQHNIAAHKPKVHRAARHDAGDFQRANAEYMKGVAAYQKYRRELLKKKLAKAGLKT